jgi:hypothetical protein
MITKLLYLKGSRYLSFQNIQVFLYINFKVKNEAFNENSSCQLANQPLLSPKIANPDSFL